MRGCKKLTVDLFCLVAIAVLGGRPVYASEYNTTESLRLAITNLTETFKTRYPNGNEYLARLALLEKSPASDAAVKDKLAQLRSEALLANPLLNFDRLLLVERKVQPCRPDRSGVGLPVNHQCNSGLPRQGYDNRIAVLSPLRTDGKLGTIYRPSDGGYVGEMDLHYDADRILFTKSDRNNWKIFEINTNGAGIRQVSNTDADVDCFDACYLPNGKIVFGSTASYHAVPCWHGQQRACNLYLMDNDGQNMRQLCYDQDNDLYPAVLNDGRVIFSRWDYTGIHHAYLRPLMAMNPDGTGQRAVYGSNSWWPNALYFPRSIPGSPSQIVAIVSGYHGPPRMGELVLLDTSKGVYDADGIVQRIPGRGKPVKPIIRDKLVDQSWPRFLHPYPLSEKYFLVSCQLNVDSPWRIYLADLFDNLVLVHERPGFALFEPLPLKKTFRPPVISPRIDLNQKEAVVYLHDVYTGPGLTGVPRGWVKRLRILSYDFGYPGLAGPDRIGRGGPWEVMRIIGTVPVEQDGSAMFRVPANTPLALQPLDGEGKAIQQMRSWLTTMPGENLSCVGCHENPADVPTVTVAQAARRRPDEIKPWYGQARGFDFEREVQPVLDKFCVGCHNGSTEERNDTVLPDLRSITEAKEYQGRRLSELAIKRMPLAMKQATKGMIRYTPAYEALLPYVRRVGIDDDVNMLVPGEYHADTSELIQMLAKGHHNVRLDAEAWDRLITWIDLNAPCHGTWGEVFAIPSGAHERRMSLRRMYGGLEQDPEVIHRIPRAPIGPFVPEPPRPARPGAARQVTDWSFSPQQAKSRQLAAGPYEKTMDLGGGVTMRLVRIPPGEFVVGDATGEADEQPITRAAIKQAFWMGACEVTNEQYHRFDPAHDSGYYSKRHWSGDDPGLPLDKPDQPVVRVSWERTMAFCQWLSNKTGQCVTLPTEAQWEYACRAGTVTPLSYGELNSDFSKWANVGDKAMGRRIHETALIPHIWHDVGNLCDVRFNDNAVVTISGSSYEPNAWGLYDMHGNAAEWTRTTYQAYPYKEDDGRNNAHARGKKIVRGGSFCDRPERCRSAFRLSYPAWQRVFNVGFRVVIETDLRQASR